jgi:hypothetical protein
MNQKRLGNSKAPPDIYLLLKFKANLPNLTSRILNNEFAKQIKYIFMGGIVSSRLGIVAQSFIVLI